MKRRISLFLALWFAFNGLSAQADALEILKKEASVTKTAESYMDVADYYFANNLPRDEIFRAYHDSAYHAAVREGAEEVLGRYFYRKAWLYNTHQNLDSLDIIRKYLLESLAHFEKAEKFYRHNQTYMKLGMTLYHSNMIDSALYFLYKSLDERYMKESSASHYGIYRNIYFFIGNIYYLKTEIDSALKYSQLLVNLAEENNDPWPAAEHTMFMGDYYKDIGEHNRSLDYYMDAGNRFLQIEDYLYAAHCRKLAAEQLSVSFGRQNEAIILYEEAIELAQKGENKSFEADCLFLMGNSYERDGKFDHAIDFYRQSATLYNLIGEKDQSNKVRYSMMMAFKNSGQVDSARAYLHKIDPYDYKLPYDTVSYNYPLGNQELQSRLDYAKNIASMNTEKFDLLSAQYYEKEAASLRLQILLISISALFVIVVLILLYARQRQKMKAEQLKRYAEEKEYEYAALQSETELRLTRKYIDGLENERERLSRELHDGVCNDLLAVEINLKNHVDNRQELENHLAFLSKTRENIRHVSHELTPPVFQYAHIDEMLSDYVSHIDRPDSMQIEYFSETDTDWNAIPDKVAYEVYRIVQEALGNSVKHSLATRIEVSMTKKGEEFRITVKDNGKGFDKERRSKGIGINTMLERVKSLNGTLTIDAGNGGTLVTADFKL